MALPNLRVIRRASYGSFLREGEAIGLRTSILVAMRRVSYGSFLREGKAIGLRTSILVAINKGIAPGVVGHKQEISIFLSLTLATRVRQDESDLGDLRILR